jgi:hypothetical protein
MAVLKVAWPHYEAGHELEGWRYGQAKAKAKAPWRSWPGNASKEAWPGRLRLAEDTPA